MKAAVLIPFVLAATYLLPPEYVRPEWVDGFAAETYEAFRTGGVMPQLSQRHPDATAADGYAVQQAFVAAMADHDPIGGYKAAGVSQAARDAMGLIGPTTGVVPASGILYARDGVVIDLARDPTHKVETEIGYRMGETIAEQLPGVEALKAKTAAIMPIIEIPGGACEEVDPVTAADLAARNVNAKILIVGEEKAPEEIQPSSVDITLKRDGAVINEARGDEAAGGQWATLLMTVNQIVAQGNVITPEHVITNGALGKILPLEPGAHRADFGDLGSITFEAVDTRQAVADRPNIVFIMADDLGYGHLGAYGQEKIHTPNLDALADQGVRFTQSYAGAPLCAPARSVLMTGRHAGRTPVRGNSGGIPLRDDDITVAEILRDAGYRTGLFGKWGLGEAGTSGAPNRQGFDEFFGYLHQKHAHFYYTDYLWHNDAKYPLPGNVGDNRAQYAPDVIQEKALEFIGAEDDKPFFAFLSMTIPHHEWTAPEKSMQPYRGLWEEERPDYQWREGYAMPDAPKANMAGMIAHMDAQVGEVMALLEEQGLADNTLVIFTSDNGPDRYSLACADFFNARGGLRGYKYDLYEGGIRVPTIARWPGHLEAGTDSAYPWHFADLMPTFADLAGVVDKVPTPVDGESIVPALSAGAGGDASRFFYWTNGDGQAVRWGDWKLVQPEAGGATELYDLAEDLAEAHDVSEDHPEIVAYLSDRMARQHWVAPPQIEPSAPDGRYYR
jgi:arylsulfatase A-like enzyme/2-keto-4-pentenoate hydratase